MSTPDTADAAIIQSTSTCKSRYELPIVIVLLMIAMLAIPYYSYRDFKNGYQSNELAATAKPLTDAMRSIGATKYVCRAAHNARVSIKGEEFDVWSEDQSAIKPSTCPFYADFDLDEQGNIKLQSRFTTVTGHESADDLEKSFKSEAPDVRQREFAQLAKELTNFSNSIPFLLTVRAQAKTHQAEKEAAVRTSWEALSALRAEEKVLEEMKQSQPRTALESTLPVKP